MIFTKYPLEKYIFKNDDDYFLFRNIFVKLRIIDSLRDDPRFLTTIVLNSSERADVVSYKLYGRSDLFWTLYLVNDILDPNEWLMDQTVLNSFIKNRYDNPGQTHHYVRNGQIADPRAGQIMVMKNPFKTIDSDPDPSLTDITTYYPVSNVEFEETKNDSKRIIKAIRKEYMTSFLADVDKKLKGILNE